MSASHSRRNIICHSLDGVFFFAALIMFSREVIIPAMIQELTDSVLLVGLVQTIVWIGIIAPQVLYAKRIEGLGYKKHTVLLWVLFQRIGWLVFLVSLLVWWGPVFTLTVFFVTQTANSLGSGFLIPVWTDWYAKTVPESMWGRLLGYRRAIPGAVGLGLGFVIDHVMETCTAPLRYQVLAGCAVLFYALSALCVALVHEEPEDGLPHQREVSWRDYLGDVSGILVGRLDFRRFMIASLLTCVPLTVTIAFLTRYGLEYPGVSEAIGGTFTRVMFVASAAGALLGGTITDRWNALVPFRVFPLFGLGAAGIAFVTAHPAALTVAFALYGFAFGVRMVVLLPAVFRYAGPERRPTYTAVSFTVLSLPSAVLPPVLGLMLDANLLGFPVVFLLCAVTSLFGWALFLGMPAPRPPDAVTEAKQ